MARCYQIFEYWKDKVIASDGKVMHWKEAGNIPTVDVVRDEYRAECWGCGLPAKRSDTFSDEMYEMELSKVWADKRINSRLQKCHIFAKQFGGEDTPENLFLLCSDCHAESPDTKNRATFFRWVYRRRRECAYGFRWKLFAEDLVKEIESRGYDANDFCKNYTLNIGDYGEATAAALKNCGTHGTHITESTVVGCVIDELERRFLACEKRKVTEREEELSNV